MLNVKLSTRKVHFSVDTTRYDRCRNMHPLKHSRIQFTGWDSVCCVINYNSGRSAGDDVCCNIMSQNIPASQGIPNIGKSKEGDTSGEHEGDEEKG